MEISKFYPSHRQRSKTNVPVPILYINKLKLLCMLQQQLSIRKFLFCWHIYKKFSILGTRKLVSRQISLILYISTVNVSVTGLQKTAHAQLIIRSYYIVSWAQK